MNAALKEKWLKALRSGRYRQGQGNLRYKRDDGSLQYCCLGILGNCIDPRGWIYQRCDGAYAWKHEANACFLPSSKLPQEIQGQLARLNDVERKSFSEIADYIEENIDAD